MTRWSSGFDARSCDGAWPARFCSSGPSGIGKRLFAEKLAQALLCQSVDEAELAPCGRCDSCVQVARRHASRSVPRRQAGRQEHDSAGGPDRRRRPSHARGLVPRYLAQAVHGRPQGGHHRRCRRPERGGRQRAAQDARGAAATLGADPDRHQRRPATAHDPFAQPGDPFSRRSTPPTWPAFSSRADWWPTRPRPAGWPSFPAAASNERWSWRTTSCGLSASNCSRRWPGRSWKACRSRRPRSPWSKRPARKPRRAARGPTGRGLCRRLLPAAVASASRPGGRGRRGAGARRRASTSVAA